MAYDTDLADRLRVELQQVGGVTEKKMFGGLAFHVGGNMAVPASGQGGLLVRCDPADTDRQVTGDGVTRMELRGREMDGWLRVEAGAASTDTAVQRWSTSVSGTRPACRQSGDAFELSPSHLSPSHGVRAPCHVTAPC